MTKEEIIGLLEQHIKKLRYGPIDPSKTKEEFLGLTEQQAEELLKHVRADDEETIQETVGAFGARLTAETGSTRFHRLLPVLRITG